MNLRTSHALGSAGLALAGAVALALWRCGGSSEPSPREPRAEADSNAEERSAVAEPAATAPLAARAHGTVDPAPDDARQAPNHDASAHGASGGTAATSSAAARVNAALERDPRDLALFSRIERELERSPPPAVNTLVELRAHGASRDELLAEARRLFADDFRLRALVVRWIDEVAPQPGGASKPVPSASGSGTPVVQPIHKK